MSPEDVALVMQDAAASELGSTQPDMQLSYSEYQKVQRERAID